MPLDLRPALAGSMMEYRPVTLAMWLIKRIIKIYVGPQLQYSQKVGSAQGRPQDLGGGGANNFFFRFGNLHVAKRYAAHGEAMRIARGVRGHAPPRKFFKTVQFGAF